MNKESFARLSLALLLLSAAPVWAHREGPPATGGRSEAVPLFSGLGDYHRPIRTRSPDAQRYFDQGLRLVYAFNHDEAGRSFREAARLDPECAMAWWGVALTLGPNINLPMGPEQRLAAVEAVEKAQALSPGASEVERAYIEALAKRYSLAPDADQIAIDAAYARVMGELSRRYPDDLDAAVLYAESLMDLRPWRLWTVNGKPEEGTEEIVSVLESVLRRNPLHPGANHYYIHAVEASPHPEWALPSARRLETLMPGAGHVVHMPAHVYMRTGDYRGAARSNEAAVEADRAYLKAGGSEGIYPVIYLSHNLHFLSASASMAGQGKKAKKAAAELSERMGKVDDVPTVEYFLPTSLFVALRFQEWDEILSTPKPEGKYPIDRALWHFARGVALAGKGDPRGAQQEVEAFDLIRASLPADATLNVNRTADVLKVAGAMLAARLAASKADKQGAVEAWKRAVEAQDALTYDEPPVWYYPVRESLGGSLLLAGKPKEAEAVFRADLDRNPRNGRSLFGLSEALKAQQRFEEAEWVRPRIRSGVGRGGRDASRRNPLKGHAAPTT